MLIACADFGCGAGTEHGSPAAAADFRRQAVDAGSEGSADFAGIQQPETSPQMLSNLLWAAFGVNRPDSGKRTAPSAMNWQEIDVYVATQDGLYVYDAKANALKPVWRRTFARRQASNPSSKKLRSTSSM